ncbi:Response regulator receiver domain-containing protein [Lachnospiraceae bacterium NE2001]|nr:Response regulator receiver domain-containing protein [Lachnospiraceae bacterium NE2001]
MGKIVEKGKEVAEKQLENLRNLRNRRNSDYEFTGLSDKNSNVEKELSLYTREGQFYVLLVDADADERITIERMIDQTGCFVTSVSSGIECLDQISRDKYDLIFLSRNMPRMDGIQTLNNMKNSSANRSKDAKVYVILEEKVDEPDIYFENAGFDGIVRKPIDRTILQNIIISRVPSKMLPDDEELLQEIRTHAEDAEALKSCGVRFIEALKSYKGNLDEYKEDASKFCDDYEVISSDMIDALYSGKSAEYMTFARTVRESARKLGAIYLSYCFDDHVNMAKDDNMDIAESNWRTLVAEWENVVSGLAGWLGKSSIQLGATEILTSNTNGIRLPMSDVKVRIDEILGNLEDNDQETARRNASKLSLYELDPDIRLKVDRVIKAFDKNKVNTAVDILRSI